MWALFEITLYLIRTYSHCVGALHKAGSSVRNWTLLVPTRGPLYLPCKTAPQQDPGLSGPLSGSPVAIQTGYGDFSGACLFYQSDRGFRN